VEVLSECINSINKSSYKLFEIIIVDNKSTDGSQEWIREKHPNITLLENNKNYGYAGGCNRGVSIAKGDYIVFLNNDTIQDPNWLEPLINLFEKDVQIAAVQPKILNYYNKNTFDYAGACGGQMDIFCYPFARGRIFLEQEKDIGQYEDSAECFWASGAAFMIRKEVFLSAGKFESIFFSHMEEIDLCWRLQAMGYKVFVEPNSIIYHKNAISLPMGSRKKYYLNHRNSLIMLFSNYSLPLSFYIGILRVILDFIALFYSIIRLNFKQASGIFLALLWIISHPIPIFKKRYRFKKLKVNSDKRIMSRMFKKSIVLEHFLFKKNNYSDLSSKAD